MGLSGSYFFPVVQKPLVAYQAPQTVQASLPVGSLSGSIFWLTDLKCLAVYGPLGWTRVVTGSL
jgi:hypothetical protein